MLEHTPLPAEFSNRIRKATESCYAFRLAVVHKVQYDDGGRRLYTIYEDNDKLVFNHIGVQVNIGLDGYETDIQIKLKGKIQ